MKCLTLRHPWAFAIAYCGKDIENRDWDDRLAELMNLPGMIGQRIGIHGGSAPKRGKNQAWRELNEGIAAIHDILDGELPDPAAGYLAQQPGLLCTEHFITPGVVAVATLAGASRNSTSRWAVPYCLHLELVDVTPLAQPVTCPGAQGFWSLPADLEEVLERRLQAAVPERWGHLTAGAWLQ